jgi:hypothetical protein
MDGLLEIPARKLNRAFLESNLDRLWLGARTRERIAALNDDQAEAHPRQVSLHDGTPVLDYRGSLLDAPTDDLSLDRAIREGPHDSAYVVFGLGLGHTARALRALTEAPILIYEPDPVLLKSALSIGPSDLGAFPIVCTSHDLTQLWPAFGGNRENVTLISTPGYSSLYASEDRDLREALTQLVQRRSVNDATHRVRAREWISDVLENLELLTDSPLFVGLTEKYKDVPAFIVGAGPSLGKNAELLADATKKGIVFAVNSSALALARRGITPQVVACMESIDLSALLAQVPYLDRVVRAFSMTAHPKTLRTGKGPLLPLYEGLPQFAPLSRLGGADGLAVCGSVSTLAFSLAQRLGCSPIVLVGQDLAYTGGQAYASGSPYDGSRVKLSADGSSLVHERSAALKAANDKLIEQEPLREVVAWGGDGKVHSTIGFNSVRNWFELAAEVLGHDRPEQRLVNATEGGARVTGFEERPLRDVLAPLPDRDISPQSIAETARIGRPPLTREQLAGFAQAQRDGARAARHAARRVRRLALIAEGAVAKDDPRAIRRAFEKLEQGEQALRKSVAASPFVDGYSWSAVDAVMQETRNEHDRCLSAERAVQAEARVAAAIESSTRELEERLDALIGHFGAKAP